MDGQLPPPARELVNRARRERRPRRGGHDVVGDADRVGQRRGEVGAPEKVEAPAAADVEVEVDPPEAVEDEVADRVDALDRVRVRAVGREEPGVVLLLEEGGGWWVGGWMD